MKIESIPRDRTVAERGRAHRLGEIISLSGAVPVALQMPYCIRVHAIRFGERVEEGKKGARKVCQPGGQTKESKQNGFPSPNNKTVSAGVSRITTRSTRLILFCCFCLVFRGFFLSCFVECQLHSNGLHFNYICRKVIP